jgi:hypothetical protein
LESTARNVAKPRYEEFSEVSNRSIWMLLERLIAIVEVLKKELPFDSLKMRGESASESSPLFSLPESTTSFFEKAAVGESFGIRRLRPSSQPHP